MRNPDELFCEREAADYLRISVYWLQQVRSQRRTGPQVTRIGTAIRYRQSALERFLAEHTEPSDRQAPPRRGGK